ncbi:DUF3179 domain-containing protein [uncultured Croceitalea sp.]|uniref:DUF3179 domain-containing protein n=1 Tax=uncultured Croceitalea sp. TaxID=1798908 RepID=UPI003305ADA7
MLKKIKLASFVCFGLAIALLLYYFLLAATPIERDTSEKEPIEYFLNLINSNSTETINKNIALIDENWEEGYQIMLIETIYFSQNNRHSGKLLKLLEKKTGKNFGYDFDKWFEWIWNKEETYPPSYFNLKAEIHKQIDPKFEKYFLNRSNTATIRLDEVRWGGVLQDGIPPLRNPKMTNALNATYLKDNATVFGIAINGDARAYPKQILAWHEMFVDTVGNEKVAGVYCTLCGTVILYKTEQNGINYEMGTSGFLYRSNKLMYDKATQSLWSTLEGEPVIGPLVGKGVQLDYLSVVTTTWGEWKKRHPDTKVLSLNTGHRRDYRDGVAYKDYFSTDELMFTVPKIDKSLKNKDEILAIRLPEESNENFAISSKFLKRNPIYRNTLGKTNFTVFTDKSGAHRVFITKKVRFKDYNQEYRAVAENNTVWQVKENYLISTTGEKLERLQSYNAFWFGYKAAFPDVTLIK